MLQQAMAYVQFQNVNYCYPQFQFFLSNFPHFVPSAESICK